MIKSLIKKILPDFILRFITSFFYGWKGNYSSWEEARQKSDGYNQQNILDKVSYATLKVKNGEALFERDSVLFYEEDYNYPLLTSLFWIAAQNDGKLHLMDFGGSLGSTYYQNQVFLEKTPDIKWCIVEQKNYANEGKIKFEDNTLIFYEDIHSCFANNQIDIVLLSSVIQYIEKPFNLLDEIIQTNVKYIIIDRTPFIHKKDRITVQKVHPAIYKACYPCWFFNEKKFLNYIVNKNYDKVFEFKALDKANIKSEFKGFLFSK